ncbi:hypothetical protein Lal_00000772, partial [Lupinus albus]
FRSAHRFVERRFCKLLFSLSVEISLDIKETLKMMKNDEVNGQENIHSKRLSWLTRLVNEIMRSKKILNGRSMISFLERVSEDLPIAIELHQGSTLSPHRQDLEAYYFHIIQSKMKYMKYKFSKGQTNVQIEGHTIPQVTRYKSHDSSGIDEMIECIRSIYDKKVIPKLMGDFTEQL